MLIDSFFFFLMWLANLSWVFLLCWEKEMLGVGNTDEQDTVLVLKGLTAHWRRQTSIQGSIQKSGRCPECPPQEGRTYPEVRKGWIPIQNMLLLICFPWRKMEKSVLHYEKDVGMWEESTPCWQKWLGSFFKFGSSLENQSSLPPTS